MNTKHRLNKYRARLRRLDYYNRTAKLTPRQIARLQVLEEMFKENQNTP